MSVLPVMASVVEGSEKDQIAKMPNIIVILADDLGYGDIGSFGAKNIATPRIDQLAEKDELIKDMDLVLNCAGPFSHTAAVVIEACLKQQSHYLDITGEIDVFELAASLHETAKKVDVVLCPGVGFDVIPSDCLAQKL